MASLRKPNKHPFTFRQEEFCRLYAAGMSAANAALHAGYTPSTAQTNAARLLRSTSVQACIRMHRYGHQLIDFRDYQEWAQKLLGITHRGEVHQIIAASRELSRLLRFQQTAKSFPVQAEFGLQRAVTDGIVPPPGTYPDDPEKDPEFLDLPENSYPYRKHEITLSYNDETHECVTRNAEIACEEPPRPYAGEPGPCSYTYPVQELDQLFGKPELQAQYAHLTNHPLIQEIKNYPKLHIQQVPPTVQNQAALPDPQFDPETHSNTDANSSPKTLADNQTPAIPEQNIVNQKDKDFQCRPISANPPSGNFSKSIVKCHRALYYGLQKARISTLTPTQTQPKKSRSQIERLLGNKKQSICSTDPEWGQIRINAVLSNIQPHLQHLPPKASSLKVISRGFQPAVHSPTTPTDPKGVKFE